MSGIIRMKNVIGVGLLAFSLGACSQMTRHSNTLVFGTNTSVGVKVGQDANQTPTIQIGYARQEAAFVPLLANTAVDSNSSNLNPCPGTVTDAKVDIEDCHFRASYNGVDKDAYSTVASFGTKASGGSGNASLQVAQYFATGIAAQRLVESGGANVVAGGGNSAEMAKATVAAATARKAEADAEAKKYQYLAAAQKRLEQNEEAKVKLPDLIDKNANKILDQEELDTLKEAGVDAGLTVGMPIKNVIDTLEFMEHEELSALTEKLKK